MIHKQSKAILLEVETADGLYEAVIKVKSQDTAFFAKQTQNVIWHDRFGPTSTTVW